MTWKEARTRARLSLKSVAALIGTTITIVRDTENGVLKFPVNAAIKLAAAYKIEVILYKWSTETHDARELVESVLTVDRSGRLWVMNRPFGDTEWIADGDCSPWVTDGFLSLLRGKSYHPQPLSIEEEEDNAPSSEGQI